MITIEHYLTFDGKDVYFDWFSGLSDRRAKARIAVRINRLAAGHFGDCRPVGGGVWELRIDSGPGYRVYYAQAGRDLVLLLCGGDKRKQRADIERAMVYWQDWKRKQQ